MHPIIAIAIGAFLAWLLLSAIALWCIVVELNRMNQRNKGE